MKKSKKHTKEGGDKVDLNNLDEEPTIGDFNEIGAAESPEIDFMGGDMKNKKRIRKINDKKRRMRKDDDDDKRMK